MDPVIQTFLGGEFWPIVPDIDEIKIEDIAHALSQKPRFNGHGLRFYSIAEHSLNVAQIVHRDYALQALLHDASEAYGPDLASPVKRDKRFAGAVQVEDCIQSEIFSAFRVAPVIAERVKLADRIMLGVEALLNMRQPLIPNFTEEYIAPGREFLKENPGYGLRHYRPEDAEKKFLCEFERLTR